MGLFDLKERKRHLCDPRSGIRSMLKEKIQDHRRDRCLTHAGHSFLETAVEALLVGLDGEARLLLEMGQESLAAAIAEQEIPSNDFEPGLTEADRCRDLAMCRWLLTNSTDAALFERASDALPQYLKTHRNKFCVDPVLPILLAARRHAQLIEYFDRCKGLHAPDVRKLVGTQGKMSYVIAKHATQGQPDSQELREIFERFLRYLMPRCVFAHEGGAYAFIWDIPLWMLIEKMYFQTQQASAIDRVKKALTYVKIGKKGRD